MQFITYFWAFSFTVFSVISALPSVAIYLHMMLMTYIE